MRMRMSMSPAGRLCRLRHRCAHRCVSLALPGLRNQLPEPEHLCPAAEAGLHAAPGGGLAVAGVVLQYIALLRASAPAEWVWREMAAIADMKFR